MLQFSKYHGLGNDFILIDNRHQTEPLLTPEQAIHWCDRHFGIGADGVIFALPGQEGADYTMRIFNSDGSEPCLLCFVGQAGNTISPLSTLALMSFTPHFVTPTSG